MKRIAIKHTIEMTKSDFDDVYEYAKKGGIVNSQSDFLLLLKGVAKELGTKGIQNLLEDAIEWLMGNVESYRISKTLIDNAMEDLNNKINPTEEEENIREDMNEYLYANKQGKGDK